MSIEDQLEEKEATTKTYMPLNEIPEQVFVKIDAHRFKSDQKGNECFFVYLKTKEGITIVQKYTPTTFKDLRLALKNAGGTAELKTKYWTWRKILAGRNKFPRLFPQPKPKGKSE